MSMNLNSSVQILSRTSCSVPVLLTLDINFSTANCINVITFHITLCIETISLVQGLFTGSSKVFKLYPFR